jgi:ribonuclease P protein component
MRGKKAFDRVFGKGKMFRCREMTVRVLPNGLDHSRLGMLVGKRQGNAVRRARIKRLLRECFRTRRTELPMPCDVVIVPHTSWRELSLAVIEPVFVEALQHAGQAISGG